MNSPTPHLSMKHKYELFHSKNTQNSYLHDCYFFTVHCGATTRKLNLVTSPQQQFPNNSECKTYCLQIHVNHLFEQVDILAINLLAHDSMALSQYILSEVFIVFHL